MRIRLAKPSDAEQIYEVHDSNGETQGWEGVSCCREELEWMSRLDAASMVAETDGKIVGEMKVWWGDDVAELGTTLDVSTLYIHRDYHRRGIGSDLIRWAVGASRQHGCASVTVWHNEDSAPFYRKQGFEDGLALQRFAVDPAGLPEGIAAEMERVILAELEPPCGRSLMTQRILHPSQWWHGLVRQETDTPLEIDGERRASVLAYTAMGGSALVVYRLRFWENDPTKAELFVWGSGPPDAVLAACLTQARELGLRAVSVLAYGEVAQSLLTLGVESEGDSEWVLVRRDDWRASRLLELCKRPVNPAVSHESARAPERSLPGSEAHTGCASNSSGKPWNTTAR